MRELTPLPGARQQRRAQCCERQRVREAAVTEHVAVGHAHPEADHVQIRRCSTQCTEQHQGPLARHQHVRPRGGSEGVSEGGGHGGTVHARHAAGWLSYRSGSPGRIGELLLYAGGTSVTVGFDARVTATLEAPAARLVVNDRGVVDGCLGAQTLELGFDARAGAGAF